VPLARDEIGWRRASERPFLASQRDDGSSGVVDVIGEFGTDGFSRRALGSEPSKEILSFRKKPPSILAARGTCAFANRSADTPDSITRSWLKLRPNGRRGRCVHRS
jgi:hypothetical protein